MIFYSPHFIIKMLRIKVLKKNSAYLKGKILDVGCGVKPYKEYLIASTEYIGIDGQQKVRPDILARAQEIPFPDNYFDSVLCTEVLEHLPEPEEAIRQIKRVLKKNGYLYLTVPQEWPLHYEPDDYYRFTKYGIKYLLEKNDFKIVGINRIGGVFSLIGQRLIDVVWQFIVNSLKPVFGLNWAERIASLLCFPFSFIFYILAKAGDRIDKSDALAWAVLAKK